MLSILRAPLMVRTAIIAILLTAFFVTSASAVRVTPEQMRAHASIGKTSLHRTRHLSHSVPKRSTRYSTRRMAHRSVTTSRSSASRRAALRRRGTRGSAAHLQRVSTATVSPARIRTAHLRPEPGPEVSPSDTHQPATDAAFESSPDSSVAEAPAPAETPVAAPPTAQPAATDPAEASIGSTIEIEHPIAPTAGTVASLHRPKMMFASPLRGSHDSLVRQNVRSEADYLERIEDDADLRNRISHGMLVAVPESAALAVNPNLPQDRRYCRPWTATFLRDLARAHEAQFNTPLMVSSAVRTVAYQKHLMRTNGNAADAEGDIVSPHLTGATIDIAKSGMTRRELAWMRVHLLTMQNAGKIDVEEEFRQACFHITVYKSYVQRGTPSGKPRKASPTRVADEDADTEPASSATAVPPAANPATADIQ